MTISELQDICHDIAVNSGWWEEDRNDGECIALMHSELSEALEALREPWTPENDPMINVSIEFADVIIRILEYCGARGIDMEAALLRKIEINRDRPYKHGGKRF